MNPPIWRGAATSYPNLATATITTTVTAATASLTASSAASTRAGPTGVVFSLRR